MFDNTVTGNTTEIKLPTKTCYSIYDKNLQWKILPYCEKHTFEGSHCVCVCVCTHACVHTHRKDWDKKTICGKLEKI
jgi:hypothetical protein